MPNTDKIVMQKLSDIGDDTAEAILKARDQLHAEHQQIHDHLTKLADVIKRHTVIAHERVTNFCRLSDSIVEANTMLVAKLPNVTYELESLENAKDKLETQ